MVSYSALRAEINELCDRMRFGVSYAGLHYQVISEALYIRGLQWHTIQVALRQPDSFTISKVTVSLFVRKEIIS